MTEEQNQAGPKVPPATQVVRLSGDYGTTNFLMRRGAYLPEVQIAYETWGTISDNHDNVILVFTGLSASAHACSSEQDTSTGWWEFMIGPGKPLDTNHFYVVCVNSLGSCFGSTSPAAVNPETNRSYGLDFPELCIEDIAKAAHHALLELGIAHVHAVVGGSMGGMSALAYALQFPGESDYLITLSSASRALPFTIAVRSLQREIIRCDPMWLEGRYQPEQMPQKGMMLARKLGLMSYRASQEWRDRFDRARVSPERRHGKKFEMEFEIESYLEYNAAKFVRNFDANSYLYLSHSMDLFDVADHGGSVNAGLARIDAKRILVMGVEGDILFPIEQQREIYQGLKKAGKDVELIEVPSIYGHDSFLIDAKRFAPPVARFLERTWPPPSDHERESAHASSC